ncbi:HlyD family efflux transporter periplasmic adaptor subunit [Candidatus Chloroploca sp. Khr17]|uniref:HlyD family efflux transporter periplasmic adaptor subunit n=1 Tax=Candidatus Chloroploca sp. Khr17 TaxID=2496869 RepID=UPI001F0D8A55|nr:HlyD family efflux transporter periplasmic adaptor subunit [Candidatus Chloroploca sp. Khr17]
MMKSLAHLSPFSVALLSALMILGLAGCSFEAPGTEAPAVTVQPTASAAPLPVQTGGLRAEARIVPLYDATLSLPSGGVVAAILVDEGELVAKGQPLLRLDQSRPLALVAQAEADLRMAQASYAQLSAEADPAEVAAAEARLDQARAQLRQVSGAVTQSDLVAARAQLEQARATLAQLASGADPNQLAQARAALNQALANQQAQRDSLSSAKSRAELALEQAANALRDLQAAYSRIYWENRDMERLPDDLPQARIDAEAAALRAVENGQTALAQAQLEVDQAHQAEGTGLNDAEARVQAAQARIDELLAGADPDQLAAARAQVAASQANLARLQGDERGGALEAAQAGIDQAQANLELLQGGTPVGDLAIAAAQVERAEVALQLAQVALNETELHAPFAGTVATIMPHMGEYVGPGTPLVHLADLSGWQLETVDLTEISIVRIREGSPVTISFDALPDLDMRGTVSAIETIGTNIQGDIVYGVTITLDQQDPRLRWNMTASVLIEA